MFNLFKKRDVAGARALVDEGATLLDVRTPAEFAGGHVSGARNIPVDALPARTAELGNPQTPVVVYCRSGMRSARATKILKAAGFATVMDIGPMPNW